MHPAVFRGNVPAVPPVRNLRPGYTVIHPNRDKAEAKATKAIVVLILLVSVALMLLITFGGWSKLEGLTPLNFVWCLAYLVVAFYIWRWSRGALPIAAGLAILLLMVVVIAAVGLSGTSWFDLSHSGFAHPKSIFGSTGLPADFLGVLVVILAPVQILLILFAMRGFSQGWNVEVEVPIEEAKRRGSPPVVPPKPSTA
jgi:lysylphosphatidylglycerol synthetase-like protein (DUF2156 family)